jgi:hypothetical protein
MASCVAPGYDNFNINHLKQLILYKPGAQGKMTKSDIFTEEFAQFVNRTLVHHEVPKEVSGYLSGGEQISGGEQ